MKKILITNAFGPQNRGDHELLQRLLQLIESSSSSRVDISILTTHPKESAAAFPLHSSIKSPFGRPTSKISLGIMIWDLIFWFLSSYIPYFSCFLSKERGEKFQLFIDADVIILCPGGYLYSNSLSLYVNLLNILPTRIARCYKVASPMSIGPFENKFDQWFTKKVLKKLNDIYTRESYSEKLADEMKLSPKYCHDLAWLSDGDVLDVDCSWMGHFVGTVICWNYPGKNKNIMRERYINNYLDAVDILVEYSGKPFVIYNQVGDGSGTSLDEILIEEMIQRAGGKIIYDSSALDPSVLKSRMKGCEGVIASRFHSALFSIQVLTPFCSIAYQPKAEFILKDLNLSKFCFTIDNFDGKELAYDLIRFSQARLDVERKLIIAQEETLNNINTTILTKLKSVLS